MQLLNLTLHQRSSVRTAAKTLSLLWRDLLPYKILDERYACASKCNIPNGKIFHQLLNSGVGSNTVTVTPGLVAAGVLCINSSNGGKEPMSLADNKSSKIHFKGITF